MLAILCPGQGSQTPGFLRSWLELDGVSERLQELGRAAGIDLVTHGTESDADTIKDTAVAQPLIVAAGLVTAGVLFDTPAQVAASNAVLAGHSVGELTATALAGVITDQEAVSLVAARGKAMARASAAVPTGMAAVVGGDPGEVTASLEAQGLTAANVNGGGQVVAAGTLEQIAALGQAPPARARVIPLAVAGAFHTHHMAPAVETLKRAADAIAPLAPRLPLLTNSDGTVVSSGEEALERLVRQVSSPVRWDLCMSTMLELGVTGIIELAPAGTLVGLAKRGMRGVEALAVKTPEDLDAARALIANHRA